MKDTAVLLIIFNRPDTTKKVFEAIRKAKPKKLFVASDGPRSEKAGEKEKCDECRRIATNIDWDCELHTLFRDQNVGCGRGPSEAISWMFQHTDRGIILEDDCMPTESFFPFCEELLEKYKEDEKVYMISGSNQLIEISSPYSYVFTNYAGIWGWATWKRAWDRYDYFISSWKETVNQEKIRKFFGNKDTLKYYSGRFDQTMAKDNVSWWDYQWYYCRIINNGMGIIPAKNLIANIGFGEDATHTFDTSAMDANRKTFELEWPLKHPPVVAIDPSSEKLIGASFAPPRPGIRTRLKRVALKILGR